MSEGVGDLLFFLASVLPVGWGISKVFDIRGRARTEASELYPCAFSTPKAVSKGRFNTRQSKNGTDPTKTATFPIVFAKKQ